MKIQFSIPSKTFLIGEYLALEGAPAILMATQPKFHVIIEKPGEGACEGIHRQSPTGTLIREQADVFQKINFKFLDSHSGLGGFGASGAQFLASYLWSRMAQDGVVGRTAFPDLLKEMWRTFKLVMSDRGENASGYDLISQFSGGLKAISSNPWEIRDLSWKFESDSLLLFRTGVKVPTHEHLQSITKLPSYDLKQLVQKAEHGLLHGSAADFAEGLNRYQEQLYKLGLLHPLVKPLKENLAKVPGVHAAKGCGAMGADVVLVFCKDEVVDAVKARAQEMNMTYVASQQDICEGLEISVTDLMQSTEASL